MLKHYNFDENSFPSYILIFLIRSITPFHLDLIDHLTTPRT